MRVKVQQELFDKNAELIFSDNFVPEEVESFRIQGQTVVRSVRTRSGVMVESTMPRIGAAVARDLASEFDLAWLRSTTRPEQSAVRGKIRIVDLFSGCGGLSVGIEEAGRALGVNVEHVLAADMVERNLEVYRRNFFPLFTDSKPVEQVIDSPLGASLSPSERDLRHRIGGVDFVVGGPPCQGHSDLNNHTRREDPKNSLYKRMARAAEVLEPAHVIIENVPGVRHDRNGVFDQTVAALTRMGYHVDACKIPAEQVGVAQRRHRAVVVASRTAPVAEGFLQRLVREYAQPARTVGWACGDLLDVDSGHPFDTPTVQSEVSKSRIDWLFDHNEYNLPDEFRPDCHRTKRHTYKSVYGRLWWDRPAWTITTGFPVMGQGRFLHPLRRRGITPHEAARLQFFPDFFEFGLQNRKGYAEMIGNAVPAKLGYVLALELLR